MKALALMAMVLTAAICPIQGLQVNGSNAVVQDNGEIAGIQRADIIIIKHRNYNGVMQYRRWNETQGYWIDPDWIDIS